jgi:hypothetical protein
MTIDMNGSRSKEGDGGVNDGGVGTLPQGYIHNVPLPRVPLRQSPMSQIHTIPDYYNLPYIVPTYATPCSIVENTAYAFSSASQAIAINT